MSTMLRHAHQGKEHQGSQHRGKEHQGSQHRGKGHSANEHRRPRGPTSLLHRSPPIPQLPRRASQPPSLLLAPPLWVAQACLLLLLLLLLPTPVHPLTLVRNHGSKGQHSAEESLQGPRLTALLTSHTNGQAASSLESDVSSSSGDVSSSSSSSSNKSAAVIFWPGLPFGSAAGPLQYHNGAVMAGRLTVYPIFYGSWSGNFGQSVLKRFLNSISSAAADGGGVPSVRQWWNIMSPYHSMAGGKKLPLAMAVKAGKIALVNKGFKTFLNDGQNGTPNDIRAIVQSLIQKGTLPADPSGYYPVMTSKEIRVGSASTGFCGYYCGWHDVFAAPGGKRIKFAFVGDSTKQCNGACAGNMGLAKTPNGWFSMDSLMSTFAHELAEAASNPELKGGWWAADITGQTGYENCDLCNGKYTDARYPNLPVHNAKGQFAYNVKGLFGTKFLIQTNVDAVTQKCVLRR